MTALANFRLGARTSADITDYRAGLVEHITRFLLRLPHAKAWTVEVREYKPKRSLAQNAYLWGIVYPAILQNEQLRGWTAEDLHEYCLGEWAGWERIEALGKVRLKPQRRSSALNKQEFTDFIEFVKSRMAEHGIIIPEANE